MKMIFPFYAFLDAHFYLFGYQNIRQVISCRLFPSSSFSILTSRELWVLSSKVGREKNWYDKGECEREKIMINLVMDQSAQLSKM